MPRKKATIDLPTAAAITKGLTLREQHRSFAEAEDVVAAAEGRLEEAEQQLADEKAHVAGQQAAGAGVDDLAEGLRRVEAAKLVLQQRQADLETARGTLERERKPARSALGRELLRRVEGLQAEADELAPLLRTLRDVWRELEAAGVSFHVPAIKWPCSPDDRHRVPSWYRQ